MHQNTTMPHQTLAQCSSSNDRIVHVSVNTTAVCGRANWARCHSEQGDDWRGLDAWLPPQIETSKDGNRDCNHTRE